jgi:PhoH-like ATPase
MSDVYSGVRVLEVSKEIIDELYAQKSIETFDNRYNWYENLYLVLKDASGGQSSALARVKNNRIHLLENNLSASNIKAKNKEQRFALDALMDDSIPVVVLSGRAGTGKSLLTLAAAIQKIQEKKYAKVFLSKTMTNVGREQLGILPGSVEEKFSPYLASYRDNIEFLVGGDKGKADMLMEQSRFEFQPIQLIRGRSIMGSFMIFDECQNLGYHEMLTIGTRVGEGSKIVILGDLNQRDDKTLTKEKTGLYKFVNSPLAMNSNLAASIELLKSERSPVASLFADIFEG